MEIPIPEILLPWANLIHTVYLGECIFPPGHPAYDPDTKTIRCHTHISDLFGSAICVSQKKYLDKKHLFHEMAHILLHNSDHFTEAFLHKFVEIGGDPSEDDACRVVLSRDPLLRIVYQEKIRSTYGN